MIQIVVFFVLAASLAGTLNAQTVEGIDELVFGRFVSPASAGMIDIDPFGIRNCYLITCLDSPAPEAASFLITGEPGQMYSITLPGSASLSSADNRSMLVDNFVDSGSGVGVVDAQGQSSFSLGARLNISADQASGSYSGNFIILINYQ